MISALLLSLALGQLLPKDPPIRPRVFRSDGAGRISRLGSDDFAFFEAFPASGAGTSGACSTTAPTGAKGEALTFTRASAATCTKTATGGLATTGIANGDLVVMASNQPRVEYDSGGKLKLLVESSRTNAILRSQELDNATWTLAGIGGGTAPTVTANAATAPDGTVTADRIDFPAVGAGQTSAIYQTVGGTPYAFSFYVRGVSSGGTLDVCITGGTCPAACAYVAGSWTRCVSVLASTVNPFFANYNGRGAQSVYVWGVQAESNAAYATSYIPTGAGTATRSAEPGASYTLASAVGPSGCIAASFQWASSAVGAVNIVSLGVAGAGNNMTLYRTSDTAAGYQVGVTISAPAVASMGTAVHRSVLVDNSGTRAAYWDAASVTAPAASMSGGQTSVFIGSFNGGSSPIDGLVGEVQIDPVSSRCSP